MILESWLRRGTCYAGIHAAPRRFGGRGRARGHGCLRTPAPRPRPLAEDLLWVDLEAKLACVFAMRR